MKLIYWREKNSYLISEGHKSVLRNITDSEMMVMMAESSK